MNRPDQSKDSFVHLDTQAMPRQAAHALALRCEPKQMHSEAKIHLFIAFKAPLCRAKCRYVNLSEAKIFRPFNQTMPSSALSCSAQPSSVGRTKAKILSSFCPKQGLTERTAAWCSVANLSKDSFVHSHAYPCRLSYSRAKPRSLVHLPQATLSYVSVAQLIRAKP